MISHDPNNPPRCEWCGLPLVTRYAFNPETKRYTGRCRRCDGVVQSKPVEIPFETGPGTRVPDNS